MVKTYILACVAVLALVACGDDDPVVPGGGGGGNGSGDSGTNSDGTVSLLPTLNNSTSCNQLVRSTLTGSPCQDNATCGQGARCVLDGDGQGFCRQICFPDQDCDTCSSSEECVDLLGTDGNPLQFDLDSDGSPETAAGACLSREVVGPQGLFDPCGLEQGACAEGLTCLQLEGRPTGTCFEECENVCSPFANATPVCSGSTAGTDVCLFACNTEPCPGDLECVEVANGNSACMR